MMDERDEGIRHGMGVAGAARLAVLGGLGAAAPLVLAAFGLAQTAAAIAAALIVALATLAALLRPVEPRAPVGERARHPDPGSGWDQAAAFHAALDQLAQPLLLVTGGTRLDPDARRYLFANAAAREALRVPRAQGPLSTAIRAPEILAAVDEALFEGEAASAGYRPGGQERAWRVRAAPLGETAGLTGPMALVIFTDETEIRRGERARANFLANASHELRTPLASLAGFIETLRGHARDDADARERFLGIMHVQAERMGRLIDDLMSLSRIELAEHIAPAGRVDLALAAGDVVDALQPLAAERGVRLCLDAPGPGTLRLIADRDQVVQVAQNLIENAIKFSPRGERVEITVRGPGREDGPTPLRPGGSRLAGAADEDLRAGLGRRLALLTPERGRAIARAILTVRDHGPGIPLAALPRLTERFYRVAGKRPRDDPGTGLGLAIVKHIVSRHLGGLWVESLEGRGALFEVALPLAPEGEAEAGGPAGELPAETSPARPPPIPRAILPSRHLALTPSCPNAS